MTEQLKLLQSPANQIAVPMRDRMLPSLWLMQTFQG